MNLWKLLTQGWPVITAAPGIVLGLMAAAAGAAWWIRGSLYRATISGLTAQVSALRERLQLAADKEQAAIGARKLVEAEVTNLQELIRGGASMQAIASTSSSAVTSLKNLGRALNEVSETLDPVLVYGVTPSTKPEKS